MNALEAEHSIASQAVVELEQSVGPPGGSSDDSSDPTQAQDVAGPDSSADLELRVFKICGLCKFPFQEVQAVIGLDRTSSTQPLTWSDKYCPAGERYCEASHDKGFHAACAKIVGDDIFAKGFLESCTWDLVRFRFQDSFSQPPPSFLALRTRRLKSSLALELRHAVRHRLPIEVCENVATYCLSEYATKLHLDAWQHRDPGGPKEEVILPIFEGQIVWAQYVEIEGRNYVKSLSTAHVIENDTKLFVAKPKFPSHMYLKMYFAEDSLGVRSVIVGSDDGIRCIYEPGLRWVSIPGDFYHLPFSIKMKFDGLKLRNLNVTGHEKRRPCGQRVRWAIFPRDFVYGASPGDDLFESSHRAAIHAVEWNLPRACGYVIGLKGSCICSIIPNRSGKLSACVIDAYSNSSSMWLYFPVDPDERISELWLRTGFFPDNDDPGTRSKSLIIITNNGRSLILGPDIRSRLPLNDHLFSYEALADLPSTPTQTLYYKQGYNESWLGFEKMTTWDQRKIELSFGPPSRPGPYFWDAQFLSSSAELENIHTITPCRGWGKCVDDAIVGLLFTYTDGRQRSVGQIRLDHLEDPIMVTSDSFWLGSSDENTNHHHEEPCLPTGNITWLGVCKPTANAEVQYVEIPRRGQLEWRSSWDITPTKSLVRHLEGSELQSEMDKVLAREAASGTAASKMVKTFSVHTGNMCATNEQEYAR